MRFSQVIATLKVAGSIMSRDYFFWIAVVAAPVLWLLMSFYLPSNLNFPNRETLFSWGLNILLVPILEEYIFRKELQGFLIGKKGMKKSYRGFSCANVIVSVVFTLAHLLVTMNIYTISVFFPSLVFGFFRDRYQTIYASIILHSFYNLGYSIFYVL